MIWLTPLLLALAVDRVTPPAGGFVMDRAADLSWVSGVSPSGPWIWTEQDGRVMLQLIRGVHVSAEMFHCTRTSDGFRLLLGTWNGQNGDWDLLRLSITDAELREIGKPDFDDDGDCDQTDFGLWQRTIGQPGAMSREEFLRQLTGAR